ncbi:VCBS domain-containing protein [Xanthobacteraceae bacterium Astr-EGSB]|uniref:VCBS domain-containing protein n=1 Tax=Astrobacterium formosum TaxID=3069710 RepID=UPI0027AEE91A|nr:VCBS domain-containing protein [Xanthobacteraceae bacterium Astr-EGSB]
MADEKITLVRVGDRLVFVFDNHSTVVLEHFYDGDGRPFAGIAVQLGADRVVSAATFVDEFPISSDQSLLPAAGDAGPQSSAQFADALVDMLATGATPVALLTAAEPAAGAALGGAQFDAPAPVVTSTPDNGENTDPGGDGNPDPGGETNTAPTGADDVASVSEDSHVTATGNVLANDTDVDLDVLVVTDIAGAASNLGAAVTGQYGTLTLNADGRYVYTLSNADTQIQALTANDTLTDTFPYTVSDGRGGFATETLTITIHGSNAAPTLSLGQDTGLVATASSSLIATPVAGEAARILDASASEPEDKISSIEARVSSGYQAGTYTADGDATDDAGERLQLTEAGEALVASLGGTVGFDAASGLLTIHFAAPITGASASAVLGHIAYVNQIGDFSLAVGSDDNRTVAVRTTDSDGAASDWVQREIDIVADVVDATGRDAFTGGRFDDVIGGGGGDDVIDGGGGDDVFRYTLGDGNDTVRGGTGHDIYEFSGALSGALTMSADGPWLFLEANGDYSQIIDVERFEFLLGSDADSFDLIGDWAAAGLPSVQIDAGDGNDTIDASLLTSATSLELRAGAGDDTITGGSGDDRLTGGDGDDTLIGGSGADILVGGADGDLIEGGTGDDHIEGGEGDDTLSGGEGRDTYVLSGFFGSDRIEDFVSGEDKIELSGFSADDVTLAPVDGGSGTRISVDVGGIHYGDALIEGYVSLLDLEFPATA